MPRDLDDEGDRGPPLFDVFDAASAQDPSAPVPPAVEPALSQRFNRERTQDMPRNHSPPGTKDLVRLIESLAHRHSAWQVFSDFCEMAALSFSNAVDQPQYEKREARYMEIVKRYSRDETAKFPEMLGILTLAMESATTDVLGKTFHDLELHNKWAGQFFTPYDVCRMMAKMTLSDEQSVRDIIEARGFITASEPACGSGAMVIALAQEMGEMGINYQRHLHVTAVDVDAKCVHMAYAQFALLHIPAVVVHGNSLSMEEWSHWHTPAHILDGWRWRLKRAAEAEPGGHVIEQLPQPSAKPAVVEEAPPDDIPRDFPGSQLTLF